MTGARWGERGWLRRGQDGCDDDAPGTPLGLVTVRKRLKESVTFISWPSMMHLMGIIFLGHVGVEGVQNRCLAVCLSL